MARDLNTTGFISFICDTSVETGTSEQSGNAFFSFPPFFYLKSMKQLLVVSDSLVLAFFASLLVNIHMILFTWNTGLDEMEYTSAKHCLQLVKTVLVT